VSQCAGAPVCWCDTVRRAGRSLLAAHWRTGIPAQRLTSLLVPSQAGGYEASMTTTDTGCRNRDFPELPVEMKQAILGAFSKNDPYFSGYLGVVVRDVRRGYSKLEVENRQQLGNPAGVMHGGASFGLADTAVAVALISIYGPGNALLTIEMKINYLEPILPGLVSAEAYVLRSSRRSAYAEVDVWSAGKLAARATTTYMIKPMADMQKD
jgi:acyl-CoA thioesterase